MGPGLWPVTCRLVPQVFDKVRAKIKAALDASKLIGIHFDCWDSGTSDHIMAIFAVTDSKQKYLLNFSTLPDETHQRAENQAALIRHTLMVRYGLPNLDKVLYVGSDNAAVCNSAAQMLGLIPFIGCASHKLNLAVNK